MTFYWKPDRKPEKGFSEGVVLISSSIMGYSLTCQAPQNFTEIFRTWWMIIIK